MKRGDIVKLVSVDGLDVFTEKELQVGDLGVVEAVEDNPNNISYGSDCYCYVSYFRIPVHTWGMSVTRFEVVEAHDDNHK